MSLLLKIKKNKSNNIQTVKLGRWRSLKLKSAFKIVFNLYPKGIAKLNSDYVYCIRHNIIS